MVSVVSRKESGSLEPCGFVVYVLCYVLGLLYMIWALVPDDVLHSVDISYYPPKSFALYLPTLMLGMFLSIPFFYAVLNSRAAPNFDSLDTLWDGYAKPAPIRIERHGQRASTGSTLPNIERTADL